MDSLRSGTFMGAGSFRCTRCSYTVTLEGSDMLPDCPSCGANEFARASMFSTERISSSSDAPAPGATLIAGPSPEREEKLADARAQIDQPGDYLCYEDSGQLRTVALTREWTRVGRSLAADVRFDDPTVSRRHALIVRQPDGVRLLDDRSLNGVFVNGTRVDGRTLDDGDEIIVGRYRLVFVSIPGNDADVFGGGSRDARLHSVG
jgi:pSer/pThr/pTyr-binding forkhead associated (FHA) protein